VLVIVATTYAGLHFLGHISSLEVVHPIVTPKRQYKDAVAEYISLTNKISYKQAALINKEVVSCSKQHSIPQGLMLGLIEQESNFDHQAVSTSGAVGLTQVLIRWHYDKYSKLVKETSIKDVFDVRFNVKLGCAVLDEYLQSTKSVRKALIKYIGSASAKYNSKYADIVLKRYARYDDVIAKSKVSYMNSTIREQIALNNPI
jgi:soluble lytic murein transglycosylase-like protein